MHCSPVINTDSFANKEWVREIIQKNTKKIKKLKKLINSEPKVVKT